VAHETMPDRPRVSQLIRQIKKLELAITDYCNLQCALCSQGTPYQKNKRTMSLDQIERMSLLIRPYEFEVIKISGGEPTLHPQFREICRKLKTWFPARRYEMSTNGFRLEEYVDCIGVFGAVSLSLYPGKNDAVVDRINAMNLYNVKCGVNKDYERMEDVCARNNLGKQDVYRNCKFHHYRKIVQDRIYPCCVIFGQSIRQNIDLDEISVPLDHQWRENLERIDIEPYCKACFVRVDAPACPQAVAHYHSEQRRRTAWKGIQADSARTESVGRQCGRAITLFSIPKRFEGHIGVIQRNAIMSWTRLTPRPEIILFGTEAGTRELAAELGLRHVPDVRRNTAGTPLVDDLFKQAGRIASNEVLAYVNADILLTSDFLPAGNEVRSRLDSFLMIGRRHDVDIVEPLDFGNPEWEKHLRKRIRENGTLHGTRGIDYFVFTRGLWQDMPPFALGRTAWDNWLVYDAFLNHEVVDATECVTIAHQNHPYSHVAGGRKEIWEGEEARHNQCLAGDVVMVGMGSTDDATWRLTGRGLERKCAPDYPRQLDHYCRSLIKKGWAAKVSAHKKVFESVEYLRDVQSPAASVIIIAWRYHPDALKNLQALARQRHRNFEVVFVNNGAGDNEFKDLQPFIDTCVKLNRNTGAYLARNVGAVYAKAPILIFVDDDGIVEDDYVGSFLNLFATYDIVAARGSIWPKDPKAGPYDGHDNYGDRAFPYWSCKEGNCAYDAAAFYKVGGWDDEIIRGGGGHDLCCRLLKIEPDMRKQIYAARPILYHDRVLQGPEYEQKWKLRHESLERLRRKHIDYDVFQACYNKYLQRDDWLIRRDMPASSDSAQHMYYNQELYKQLQQVRQATLNVLQLHERGKALFAEGRFAEALRVFEQTVSVAPSFAPGYTYKGLVCWQMGRREEALRNFLAAFRINPGDKVTVLSIARFYKSMQMISEMRDLVSAYLQKNPADVEMRRQLESLAVG
jgi:tetratricopeptide (TPR) repeat protein/organic radical activating enzyme